MTSPSLGAGRRQNKNKQQMSKKKKSKLKVELLFSASSFGKMVEIKCDHHKVLNNFYLMTNNWEKSPCYLNLCQGSNYCVVLNRTQIIKRTFNDDHENGPEQKMSQIVKTENVPEF